MERSHQERDLKHSVPDTPYCRNYLLLSGKEGGLIVSNNNLSELMKGMIEYTQDIVSDVTRSVFIRKLRTEVLIPAATLGLYQIVSVTREKGKSYSL